MNGNPIKTKISTISLKREQRVGLNFGPPEDTVYEYKTTIIVI